MGVDMFIRISCLVFACLALAAPAAAKQQGPKKVVAADTSESFAVVAAAVRSEMKPDGRYEFISRSARQQVDNDLDAMAALLEKSGMVASMDDEDKIKLFNLQERVNGTLANNASDRLICTHVAPVGSHLPVTYCKTYGELAISRKDSQRMTREQTDQARADMEGAALNAAREDFPSIGDH
jgi:hypothetical protein